MKCRSYHNCGCPVLRARCEGRVPDCQQWCGKLEGASVGHLQDLRRSGAGIPTWAGGLFKLGGRWFGGFCEVVGGRQSRHRRRKKAMKRLSEKVMRCVLAAAIVLIGSGFIRAFAQTSNATASPSRTQSTPQGAQSSTAAAANHATVAPAAKAGTSSQAAATPAAQARANANNGLPNAALSAPPGWTPPAQPQAQPATGKTAAAKSPAKTSPAAAKPGTKEKNKTTAPDSH